MSPTFAEDMDWTRERPLDADRPESPRRYSPLHRPGFACVCRADSGSPDAPDAPFTADRGLPVIRTNGARYEKSQIREVMEGQYRIIYYIKPDQIDVLAVIHGARDVLRER